MKKYRLKVNTAYHLAGAIALPYESFVTMYESGAGKMVEKFPYYRITPSGSLTPIHNDECLCVGAEVIENNPDFWELAEEDTVQFPNGSTFTFNNKDEDKLEGSNTDFVGGI